MVAYSTGAGTGWIETGKQYAKGTVYDLLVTVDFATNKWSATLGGQTFFTNETFHAASLTRDLAAVAVLWNVLDMFNLDNNFLLFWWGAGG